jgi:hypothetical protein
LPLKFGIDGILYSGPIADGLSAIIGVTMVIFEFRNIKILEKEESLK